MNLSSFLLAATAQVPADLGSRLDEVLTRLEPFGFSGSVLVEKGGEVLLERGYGWADREAGERAGAGTLFDIGSVAKQFTAAAVLLLEQDGLVRLDQSIANYLSGVPEDKQGITLHHLLSHTSGLARDGTMPLFEPASWEDVLAAICAAPLVAAPGTAWAYSNLGYTLLAGVVERVSGQPFLLFLQRRLFRPAGMERTGGYARDWRGARIAVSYQDGVSGGSPRDWPFTPALLGAGGLLSTVGDLRRWMVALRSGGILDDARRDRLWTVSSGSYGYGWVVSRTVRGTRVIMHAGDFLGFNSDLRWYPDEDYLIVFLSNERRHGHGLREAVVNRISLAIQGREPLLPPAVHAADVALLRRCAGRYRLPGGDSLVVAVEDGGLRLWADGPTAVQYLTGSAAAEAGALAEKLRAAVDGSARGDLELFRALLGEAYHWESVRISLQRGWRDAIERHGPYRLTEVLGAAARAEGVEVFLRTQFWNGVEERSFLLEDGKIVSMRSNPGWPGEAHYLPVGGREFASFDVFTGAERRLRFSLPPEDRNGAADAVSVFSKHGWISARRTRQP